MGTGDNNILDAGEVINFNSTTPGIYTLEDFGNNVSTLIADPTDATNTVVSVIKGNETWAGTTITSATVIYPLTATNTVMTVRVWSPEAGIIVRLKLEESADDTHTVETDAVTTKAQEWETLTFDFSNEASNDGNPTNPLNTDYVFDKLSIFFNFGQLGHLKRITSMMSRLLVLRLLLWVLNSSQTVISKMGLQVGLVVQRLLATLRRTLPLLKQHQVMSMM